MIIDDFVRMCSDGYKLGFNEANGGNASYRMSENDVCECEKILGFDDSKDWTDLGLTVSDLANEYFAVTGAGKLMRNIELDTEGSLGIVRLNESGDAYKVVWGLKGGRPTSEFRAHILDHSVRKRVSGGKDRVMYHLHPESLIALTYILSLDDKTFSNAIWRSMTEAVMVVPDGIGVLDWMVPGGEELAHSTATKMERYKAVVWAHHGLFCTGSSFDDAFGRAHTIEKSASIYLKVLTSGMEVKNSITDDALRKICNSLGLDLNEDLLNGNP